MRKALHMALHSSVQGYVLFKWHPPWRTSWLWSQSLSMLVRQRVDFSSKCLKIIFQWFTLVKSCCELRLCHHAFSLLLFQCCSEPWKEHGFFSEIELVWSVNKCAQRPDSLVERVLQVVTAMWPSPHPILGVSRAKPQQTLGHFAHRAEAVQQGCCRSTACSLLLCLQPRSRRQLFSSFHLRGSISIVTFCAKLCSRANL